VFDLVFALFANKWYQSLLPDLIEKNLGFCSLFAPPPSITVSVEFVDRRAWCWRRNSSRVLICHCAATGLKCVRPVAAHGSREVLHLCCFFPLVGGGYSATQIHRKLKKKIGCCSCWRMDRGSTIDHSSLLHVLSVLFNLVEFATATQEFY
jgi:hypothetical protein